MSMHTRDQARGLWCPMVRAARLEQVGPAPDSQNPPLAVVGGCNTDAMGRTRAPASCRCIADECAMWRWGEWVEARENLIAALRVPVKGYCGLAGRPEVTA